MKNEQDEKYIKAQKIHEKARFFRGRFLNFVAVIERNIALIMTEYFCTEDESKREIFIYKIAEAVSLNKKRNILIEIVKKDYPNYWEKNSKFLKDLEEIQEFRNKLAHSVVDVSDEALKRPLENGIGFIQWNQGNPITDNEFNDWEVRANMILST